MIDTKTMKAKSWTTRVAFLKRIISSKKPIIFLFETFPENTLNPAWPADEIEHLTGDIEIKGLNPAAACHNKKALNITNPTQKRLNK